VTLPSLDIYVHYNYGKNSHGSTITSHDEITAFYAPPSSKKGLDGACQSR
jgi:hypothetical protein